MSKNPKFYIVEASALPEYVKLSPVVLRLVKICFGIVPSSSAWITSAASRRL